MFLAGIDVRGWISVCTVKDAETFDDLFAFLTCPPDAAVKAVSPKGMPVIVTMPEEWETWMSIPADRMMDLLRPLPHGWSRPVDEPV